MSAARTGPHLCRWSNPAARRIWNPAREGADVGRWSAQAFARVANFNVSPQHLSAPCALRTAAPAAERHGRVASNDGKGHWLHVLPEHAEVTGPAGSLVFLLIATDQAQPRRVSGVGWSVELCLILAPYSRY